MAPSSFEAGIRNADPGRVHAVKKTINGPRALCGAGVIDRMVAGRFDPATEGACDQCAAAALPAAR